MKIIYGAVSEAGLRAGENQDSIFCASHEGGGVFLVADGMGGHENGRMASRRVREEICRSWEQSTEGSVEKLHPFLLDASLKEALNRANKLIRRESGSDSVSGSTAVILRIGEEGYCVISCGDSRCYALEKTVVGLRVTKITEDDVWENRLKRNGKHRRKERLEQENTGKLLRAVGTETCFSCDTVHGAIKRKTLFALCSDGIYKYLREEEFAAFLKEIYRSTDTEEQLLRQIDHIRDAVYENGAPDNLSLILVLADPKP